MVRNVFILLTLWLSLGSSCRALAQRAEQILRLKPGWNAVHLNVQPDPAECDRLFAGLPVESVWMWNRRPAAVQFIQDATTLLPSSPDWLTWLPPSHPLAKQTSLFSLEGGRVYLIKLAPTSVPVAVTLTGIPSLRKIEWIPDSVNLVGFSLPTPSTASFADILGASSAQAAGPVYRLGAEGRWEPVANLATGVPLDGEAFWVRTRGASQFQGALSVSMPRQDGLHYGLSLVEQTLRIRNDSSRPLALRLRRIGAETSPGAVSTVPAGGVPLYYWLFDPANNKAGWVPLTNDLRQPNLPAGQEWLIRFEVRRSEMISLVQADPAPPGYQSVLELTDDRGLARLLIPVTAEDATSVSGVARASLGKKSIANSDVGRFAGLWIGKAVVDKVNQPASATAPEKPVGAGSEVQFRLIVHVDESGNVSLLQKVLLMWKEGSYEPDPKDPSKRVLSEPGRYVLVTDETKAGLFKGAALRDGQAVGRRFSSAGFGFDGPIRLGGSGGFSGGAFSGLVRLGYDDPLNPFKHAYHPDHDNLDELFRQRLPAGRESYDITRRVSLDFTSTDPHQLQLAGWGDTQVGGIYREAISGLHRNTLFLEGTFRLQRASRVSVLNDGL